MRTSHSSDERSRKLARFGVVSFVIVLGIAYLVVGDMTVWGEWLAIWPSAGWILLLVPGTIRARSVLAAGLLAGFAILTTEWPSWPKTSAAPGRTLRLVVWNIGADPGFMQQTLDLQPDVWILQEFVRPQSLPPGFGMYTTVDPSVISRVPAEVLPTRRVGPWAEPQLLLLRPSSGMTLLLANVRLMHPSPVLQLVDPMGQVPSRNHRERLEQYPRLVELIRETAERYQVAGIILAGDFNTPASAHSLGPIRELLRDVWLEAGRGWGATAPEFLPLSRIDQCWISASLRGVSASVLRRGRSDHRLLLVDLALPD